MGIGVVAALARPRVHGMVRRLQLMSEGRLQVAAIEKMVEGDAAQQAADMTELNVAALAGQTGMVPELQNPEAPGPATDAAER